MKNPSPDDLIRMFLAFLFSMLIIGLAAKASGTFGAMAVLQQIMPIVTAIIGFFFGRASQTKNDER